MSEKYEIKNQNRREFLTTKNNNFEEKEKCLKYESVLNL